MPRLSETLFPIIPDFDLTDLTPTSMKTSFLLGIGLLLSPLALATDPAAKPPEGVAFTTDKSGNKTVTCHSHNFLVADSVYLTEGKAKPTTFLIVQDQTLSVPLLSDTPPTAKLDAQAWAGTEDFPRKLLWTLKTDGNSSSIEDRLFAIKRDGFEDDFDLYLYFHMADGKPAYVSNMPLLTVDVGDSPSISRHIGFRDQWPDNEPLSKALTDKKIAGIVSYGDDQGVTKKIGIFGWPSDDKPSPPSSYLTYQKARVEDRIAYLRDNKETGTAGLSHFSAVIVLSEGIEVEIPFENDAPQLDKARLPKGYTVELMP
jgi:hypothetical protein